MKRILTPVDFGGNSAGNIVLDGAVIASSETAPSSPSVGEVYVDSATGTVMQWNGTAWRSTDASAVASSLSSEAAAIRSEFAAADTTVAGTVTTLAGRVTTAEGSISTLQTQVSSLQGSTVAADLATETAARIAADTTLTNSIAAINDETTGVVAVSKAYTDSKVAALVDAAPGTLDTLNELAAALGDDANFSTTITNQLTNITNNALTVAQVRTALTTEAVIGDGSATSFAVAHGHGTTKVVVAVYEVATNAQVEAGVVVTDSNTVTIDCGSYAPSAGELRVVVVG